MTRRLAALFLLAGLAAFAAPPMTTLRIEVKTLSDAPVERASVRVKFIHGRAGKIGKRIVTSYEMRTNQEGIAKIPPIPQGQILVQVMAKGYQTFGQKYEVNEAEKTVEVKLNPPQAQFSAHQ